MTQEIPNTNPETPPTGDQPKAFTQEQLNAIIAERVKRAEAGVLKDLGVENAEQGKALISSAKSVEEANKTELEKATTAQAQLQARIAQLEAESAQKDETNRALIRDSALKAAVQEENPVDVDAVMLLVQRGDTSKFLTEEGKADEAVIKAAVDQLKKDKPTLFTVEQRKPDYRGFPSAADMGNPTPDADAAAEARKRLALSVNNRG